MKESTRKKIRLLLIILFMLVTAGLYIYLYLIPDITGALTPTAIVSFGKVQTEDEEDCLIIRSERLIYAEDDGSIRYYSEESERTRKNAKILDIYPPGDSAKGYYAPVTSFVSYYVDGLEESYTMETVYQLDLQQIFEDKPEPENLRKEDAVARKDEPIYKLVTSNVWYAVLLVDKGKADMYQLNQSLTLYFGEDAIKGTVTEYYDKDDHRLVIIRISRYYENFAKLRYTRLKLLTQNYEGLVVPNSAISWQEIQAEGESASSLKPGVYVQSINGEYSFKTIDIIVSTDSETLIKTDGNVRIYDEILRNAEQN